MGADIVRDLSAEVCSAVLHRQQDRRDRQFGVQMLLDQLDVLQQLAQSLERIVLTLDRDEDFPGSNECVDCQEPPGSAGNQR